VIPIEDRGVFVEKAIPPFPGTTEEKTLAPMAQEEPKFSAMQSPPFDLSLHMHMLINF
jgi:hypothetical protein